MNVVELERLTRLAQSMPVKHLKMESCDGPRGQIYMAYGEGDEMIHGAWGYFGLCQAIDFSSDSSPKGIRQVLFDTAVKEVEIQVEAGVLF